MDKLLNAVIDRVWYDVMISDDYTALMELLKTVSKERLIAYLPEGDQQEFKDL